MDNAIVPPKRDETEIEMNCAHCGKNLYFQRIVLERADLNDPTSLMVEKERSATGDPHPRCDCRKGVTDASS